MTQDLSLAIVHHWALLMLISALCAEFMLLRLPPSAAWLRSLARADLVYGTSAGLMLVAGLGRVVWGAKGAAFYLQNPVFRTKLGLFLLIGLLSVGPTVQFIRWRKQHAGQGSLPAAVQIAQVRRWVGAQLVLFPLLPVLAVLMARGIGL